MDRHIEEQQVAVLRGGMLESCFELVSTGYTADASSGGPSPNAAVSWSTTRPEHGVPRPGNELRVRERLVSSAQLEGRHTNVHSSVVIAGFFDPDGCVAVAGFAITVGHDVSSHIDGQELIFLVPLVLLPDLFRSRT